MEIPCINKINILSYLILSYLILSYLTGSEGKYVRHRPRPKIIKNRSESRFTCTYAIFFFNLPLTSIVVKQSVMKQVIPKYRFAKYLTENVGRGGRGCSYKQVMFRYHKFQDSSTLTQSRCYKHSLVTLEQLDTAKFSISSLSFL